MSPNFVRDRPYRFTWSPNHDENHQCLMCSNHETTAALKTCNVVGETAPDKWLSPLCGGAAPPRGCDGAAQTNGKVESRIAEGGGGGSHVIECLYSVCTVMML